MKKFINTLLLLSSIFILGACNINTKPTKKINKATITNTPKQGSKKETKTSDSTTNSSRDKTADYKKSDFPILLKEHKLYKNLANYMDNNKEAEVIDEKDYNINQLDDSWEGVSVAIDHVSVLKVKNFEDYTEEYKGLIILHYIIDNTKRDISVLPDLAEVKLNTGEEIIDAYDFDEIFEKELMKGTKVDGYVAYPLKKLDEVTDITKMRLKFDGYYQTDDYRDENKNHEYDFTLYIKEPELI